MLVQLSIRNLVLIEDVRVEFGPGFHVISGETGSGKSMLLDALGLVLGSRARPDLVRAGAKEAEVEALFELGPPSELNQVRQKLHNAGIPDEDGQLVIRRTVHAEGRSRAYLNGRLTTVAELADLARDLCDISSQHESVQLTDPSTHGEYLDAYAALLPAREALAAEVAALSAIHAELRAAAESVRTRAEREDFLNFQLSEIEAIAPSETEDADLETERSRLRHAEKLRAVSNQASERLDDAEHAVCDILARLSADLDQAASLDHSLAPLAETVSDARMRLSDVARELARYAGSVESDPGRLAEVEERMFKLQKLLRKHGPSVSDVLRFRANVVAELAALSDSGARVHELEQSTARELVAVSARARQLSKKRHAAAARMAEAIGRELAALGMGRAKVVVDVAPQPAAVDAALLVDGARLTQGGIDKVEFLIAPNPGEEPRPLRKIASGGELSRALLALKRVLAEKGPAGTYVFDEVDAGVSGAIAEVIGRSIVDIAKHRQVLCVTHLPQIAALAGTHYVVGKTEEDGRTRTTVRKLSAKERQAEVARMIGGVKVGEAAKRAAAELIAAGRVQAA